MTTYKMVHTTALATALAGTLLASAPALAQNFPVTSGQKATAEQVAQTGVPLSELAPNAPDHYTVQRGDTLWAISGLFLKSPWRWPELWGMNLQDIRNPHRIYPGQQLYLDKKDGRATLRTREASADSPPSDTVRVSPRTRFGSLADSALPTLKTHLIEPFLAEPVIVDETTLAQAPRIVATQEERVLLSRGDRAYARGNAAAPLLDEQGKSRDYRVFRNATPLKDPVTGVVLGYEAQYVGKASLVRGESTSEVQNKDGKTQTDIVPATIDIVRAKEEMRVGDRLLPEPERQLLSYMPHAPNNRVEGRIVSVYGSAVTNAAQNQVVVINRGTQDGMESGLVMAILKDGARIVDKTDPAKPQIKLPDERNGLLMVFRPFEKLSYALILEITDGVKIGDRVTNPR
ncbi:LysM peptidoglycan-binding domain-containing protein [Variovorax terrae]|uniref:LysM peptidoglycan-binding domain-containing protein n=1 Tax=Variovorax terrae TaxID=2923278 RepID=A0A9X2ARQ2_9BURK|nr:LysM domain-containing protein [Variovorax terrae]MCJ0765847.1 LysM peptidoglycan-binding domain-containing protein [Variovorax terrae]